MNDHTTKSGPLAAEDASGVIRQGLRAEAKRAWQRHERMRWDHEQRMAREDAKLQRDLDGGRNFRCFLMSFSVIAATSIIALTLGG